MQRFIKLIGRENYDKLVENARRQEDRLQNGLPFDDLAPVVRMIFPYKRIFKDENDFFLLTEFRQDDCNDGLIYGLHTFHTGLPELSPLSLSDVLDFRGVNDTPLKVDRMFKPEYTLLGYFNYYATKGTFREFLPRERWQQINTPQARKEYHLNSLKEIENEGDPIFISENEKKSKNHQYLKNDEGMMFINNRNSLRENLQFQED